MNYFRCGGGRSTHTATKIDVAKTPLATFNSNVSGLYIPEILAYFSATQSGSGDPSPSNPRAINGVSEVDTTRTGKNLFDPIVYSSFLQPDGKYRGEAGTILGIKTYLGAYIGKQLTFSAYADLTVSPSPTNVKVAVNINGAITLGNPINSGEAGYSSITFTPQSADDYVLITFGSGGGYSYTFSDIQLELGSATEYETYTGQTATTALGGTYYGGYLNVTTGLLTVMHLGVDMGSLGWTYNASDNYFNVAESRIQSDTAPQVMCEQFTYRGRGSASTMSTAPTGSIYYFTNALRVKDTRFTDANAFVTAVTGQKVMFELKETAYETYQLTPAQIEQLLGQNNVFCSSGDVAVKYWKID